MIITIYPGNHLCFHIASMQRLFTISISLIILGLGCEDPTPDVTADFSITIENLSSGESAVDLSPGVYFTQEDGFPLFFPNSQDFGDGLEELAEDGLIDRLQSNLNENQYILDVNGFSDILPGQSLAIELRASYGTFFNFATMFTESNDLFYSFNEDGIPLFKPNGDPVSGDVTHLVWLWDAGTEINQEPYIGSFQATRQSFNGEGDPEENGRVELINDGFEYPDKISIIRVTINPL